MKVLIINKYFGVERDILNIKVNIIIFNIFISYYFIKLL